MFLGLEEGSRTQVGGHPYVSHPWHPTSALPPGDPHLLNADQQLKLPGPAACLESEPRRGGEGRPPVPSPVTALTLGEMTCLVCPLLDHLHNSDRFPAALGLASVGMSMRVARGPGPSGPLGVTGRSPALA